MDELIIHRVKRGFIARHYYREHGREDSYAFETLESLLKFLDEYFNRPQPIEEKDDNP